MRYIFLVFTITILSTLALTNSLLTREEYKYYEENATFDTLTYEEYVEIFQNKPEFGSSNIISASQQLEFVKQYDQEYNRETQINMEVENKAEEYRRQLITLPKEFDWKNGYHSECFTKYPIKDQANCGSCFTFATTFVLSRRFCIKKDLNIDLSPQDLLSCDIKHSKCDGGALPTTWRYLENDGVCTEECKPYTSGKKGFVGSCRRFCSSHMLSYQKYTAKKRSYSVYYDNEDIKKEIYLNGPVTTAVDAYVDLSAYKGGIYRHVKKKGEKFEGHAVALVGWGYDSVRDIDYWIVANSWGTGWGEDGGYFRIPFKHCNIGKFGDASDVDV